MTILMMLMIMMTMTSMTNRYLYFQIISLAKKIQQTFPSLPASKKMGRKNIALLNKEIKLLCNLIDKANPDSFSFSQTYFSVKDDFSGFTNFYSYSDLDKSYRKVFSFLDKAIVESYRKINDTNSENEKLSQFEKFGTSETSEFNRKKTLDFISQRLNSSFKLDVPMGDSQWKEALSQILGGDKQYRKEFDFVKKHEQLKVSVTEEILKWMEDTKSQLIKSNPFKEEEKLLLSMEKSSPMDFIRNFPEVVALVKKVSKDSKIDFDFYQKQINSGRFKPIVLFRNFLKEFRENLLLRKSAWEIKEIDNYRKIFIKELYDKVTNFQKLESVVSLFSDKFGVLWDLSQGAFSDYGFEVLEEFADILANEQGLRELADLIGRHDKEAESYRKEIISKMITEYEYKPKPAYKGEISGLRLGNDIPAVLPGELSQYKNRKTKKLFMLKYAQKQLLSYSYQNMMPQGKDKLIEEEVSVAEEEKKGPIILCIDTSGSMNGSPERVAKTITFALIRKAIEEDRGCYLISFSTGIETVDLGRLSKSNAIQELIAFLRMSFHGGTDAGPALHHSLEMIKDKSWKNADVLMVSDYCMGSLDYELENSIDEERKNGTKFFSLEVSSSGNNSVIRCFDQNWQYNPSSRDSMKNLVRKMHDSF